MEPGVPGARREHVGAKRHVAAADVEDETSRVLGDHSTRLYEASVARGRQRLVVSGVAHGSSIARDTV